MSGWKSWAANEVVQATDFQSYIQDQVVQVYADSGARGSALGTAVSAGMLSYLTASTALQVYNGSAWVGVPANIGTAVVAFLQNPTSANLRTAVTDETGSGSLVFATNPTFSNGVGISGTNANVTILGAGANITIGRQDGTSTTPYIDFNSGTAVVDYDARIIASGGNGSSGGGQIQIIGTVVLPSTTSIGSVSSTELGYLDGVTSAIQTQLNAKADFTQTVSARTASFTAVAADANDVIYVSGTAAITVTIADVFAVGDRLDIWRNAGGTVSIAAGSGVTDWAGNGTAGTAVVFRIDQTYNAATVQKVAANTYRVVGKIS